MPEDVPPPGSGVEMRRFAIESEAVGRRLVGRVLVSGGRPRKGPLLVLLHGQGVSPETMITDKLRVALEEVRDAPVVLLPEGGEASYWHDRRSGDWGRMVVDEAIPAAIERFQLDPSRVAIAGFSMGGFGALHLAAEHPRRFCSVAAHSPAVFSTRPRRASPFGEAFDDDADFARADPIADARDVPAGTWVDIGNGDPFAPAVRELVARMRSPRFRMWGGGHDFTFFEERTREWLRFHDERC